MNEPTLKQWKRRALKAESELATIQRIRQFDATREREMARENAILRVAMREIQEASNWAYGSIANTLTGVEG